LEFCVANTEPAPNANVRTSAIASPSFFIIFNGSPSKVLLKRFQFRPRRGSRPGCANANLDHTLGNERASARTHSAL
jgi:hypothetical protein